MLGDMQAATVKRNNLRTQLERGKSRATGQPVAEGQLKRNWPAFLDANYQCQVPGPPVCLQDALHMITTGKVLITCPGAKKMKMKKDDEEPRTLVLVEYWRGIGGILAEYWWSTGGVLVGYW